MKGAQIPAWLCASPTALERPPVIAREQGLPFKLLSWPNFERLILRAVAADGNIIDCRVYGTPGQDQHGIDLLATSVTAPSENICYQCKKVDVFHASDIRAAIKKFEEGPWSGKVREFTLCVACSLEPTSLTEAIIEERNRLAQRNIIFRVWDSSASGDLNTRLKGLPSIVDDFFGRPWVEVFNGREAADNLGDRLDGIDFAGLAARLLELYRIIFSQYDPGIGQLAADPKNYSLRYVPADVQIIGQGSLAIPEARPISEDQSTTTPQNQSPRGAQQNVSNDSTTYLARIPAWEWLRDKDVALLLGEPGLGKSAFLRQLALAVNVEEYGVEDIPRPSQTRHLPVWMSFARYAKAIEENSTIGVDDFFCSWLHQHGYGDVQALFRKALRDSAISLLVDGLDESASAAYAHEALNRLITFRTSHGATIVATSRPRSLLSSSVPMSWPHATLAPLDDSKIQGLAIRWFSIANGASGNELSDARWTHAEIQGGAFFAAISASPRTHQLARNPLLCQALIELYRQSHRLPEARVRAYEEIVELFMRRHPEARAKAAPGVSLKAMEDLRESDWLDILKRLAWDAQAEAAGGVISKEKATSLCAEYLKNDVFGLGRDHSKAIRQAPEIINLFLSHFGIIVERTPSEISFVHLSLQEFLAAKAVSERSEQEQLVWVESIALQQHWRETLTTWFGIQGDTGRRSLAANAGQKLLMIGQRGEWERLQMLSLRTDLATADLGLPVGDARNIIVEAAREVDISPLPNVVRDLASRVAVGALGGSVRNECAAMVTRWMPGRSYFDRAQLLKTFGSWKAAEDLEATLKLALHDEKLECRRAAAESYGKVFSDFEATCNYLFYVAKFNIRPEVRAAALHALSQSLTSVDILSEAADWNSSSHSSELLFNCVSIRVRLGRQTEGDLASLLRILESGLLGYPLEDALRKLICDGWPGNVKLRERYLKFVLNANSTGDLLLPLEYLLSAYPRDSEVADAVAQIFNRFGMHFGIERGRIWEFLRSGYAGNTTVVQALRTALTVYKEKYSAIIWHPHNVSAYLVMADDQARDELIASYASTTDDLQGRYWIASTLVDGWSQDEIVRIHFQQWASQSVEMAGPLAPFATIAIPEHSKMIEWLEWLVSNANDRIVSHAINMLLNERPDEQTRLLVMERLRNSRIWYYNRVNLDSRLAALYPDNAHSRQIVERAFSESDGPSLAILANGYENESTIRAQLLTAATPARIDARLGIASTMMERSGSADRIQQLTPNVLAEGASSVRAATLIARARAFRHDPRQAVLLNILSSEARAVGMEMNRRRRTAIAALLDMGRADRVAEILMADKGILPTLWTDSLEADPVSLETLLKHWPELQTKADAMGLTLEFPVSSLLERGYAPLIERTSAIRSQLDASMGKFVERWHRNAQLDILSRLHPRSERLRFALCTVLRGGSSSLPVGEDACLAARLLGEHFGGDPDVLEDVLPNRVVPPLASGAAGVLGYLVRSWPQSPLASAARNSKPEDRRRWSDRNRLICGTIWGWREEASVAAREVIARRYRYRHIEVEDVEVLRIWASSTECMDVLKQWRESTDGHEAIAALIVLGMRPSMCTDDIDWLRYAFNRAAVEKCSAPMDGFDPRAGHALPWLQIAYELLTRAA